MNGSPFLRLVELIFYSIQENGLNNTAKHLELIIKSSSLKKRDDAKFILELVSSTLAVQKEEILNGIGRKGDRVMALGFCSYYLHYKMGYPMEDVQDMLSKDIELLYKYSKIIKLLNPQHRHDQRYIQLKNTLDERVEALISSRDTINLFYGNQKATNTTSKQ